MKSRSTYIGVVVLTLLISATAMAVAGCGKRDTTVAPAEMQEALRSTAKSYPVEYRMVDHFSDQLAVGTFAAGKGRDAMGFCLARESVTLPSGCDGFIAMGGWADVIVHTRFESSDNPALGKLIGELRAKAPDVE